MTCPTCGSIALDPGQPCRHCGQSITTTAAPTRWPEQLVAAQRQLPAGLAHLPVELLAVCALMTLAGVLLLWPALQVLPDAFRLLGYGSLGRAFGLLALDLALVVLTLGVSLLLLAWRLTQADRVARGLAYILLGGYSFAVLIGNDHSAGLIVTMLLCLAAMAILAGAPNVRAFFTGPNAAHAQEAVSVTVVRTLFAVFAWMMLLFGVSYLPAGALGGRFVVVGLFLIATGAGLFTLNRHLARGEPAARVTATGLMAAYSLLVLIAGGRATATLLGLAFAAAAVGLLWLPSDAQQHFGRPSR